MGGARRGSPGLMAAQPMVEGVAANGGHVVRTIAGSHDAATVWAKFAPQGDEKVGLKANHDGVLRQKKGGRRRTSDGDRRGQESKAGRTRRTFIATSGAQCTFRRRVPLLLLSAADFAGRSPSRFTARHEAGLNRDALAGPNASAAHGRQSFTARTDSSAAGRSTLGRSDRRSRALSRGAMMNGERATARNCQPAFPQATVSREWQVRPEVAASFSTPRL